MKCPACGQLLQIQFGVPMPCEWCDQADAMAGKHNPHQDAGLIDIALAGSDYGPLRGIQPPTKDVKGKRDDTSA